MLQTTHITLKSEIDGGQKEVQHFQQISEWTAQVLVGFSIYFIQLNIVTIQGSGQGTVQ